MLDIKYAVFNRDDQGGISGNYHYSILGKGKVMRHVAIWEKNYRQRSLYKVLKQSYVWHVSVK